ncbi:DUF1178 family protein [Amaricoccus tamworthensis]|uniref:DUF1178 family protein n=1 Tax=Amaricoccus tamworthensis TaxID=57002 RepID=UPI003C7DDE17
MIRYSLRCADDHQFESWFGSSADFDRLKAAGMVSCAVCGGTDVEKELMAPQVKTKKSGEGAAAETPSLSEPASPAQQALRELRKKIESVSDNVGKEFAAEARRIHNGEAPARSIIGEAKPSEAKALVDDGIPVAPIPWYRSKAN